MPAKLNGMRTAVDSSEIPWPVDQCENFAKHYLPGAVFTCCILL